MTSDEKSGGCLKYAGVIGLWVGMYLYMAVAVGFALGKIWGWYAVPLGFAAVRWQTCAAFAMVVGLLRMRSPQAQPETPARQASFCSRRAATSLRPGWCSAWPGY